MVSRLRIYGLVGDVAVSAIVTPELILDAGVSGFREGRTFLKINFLFFIVDSL